MRSAVAARYRLMGVVTRRYDIDVSITERTLIPLQARSGL